MYTSTRERAIPVEVEPAFRSETRTRRVIDTKCTAEYRKLVDIWLATTVLSMRVEAEGCGRRFCEEFH